MTSKANSLAGDRLFDADSYTNWSRALHRLKPLQSNVRVLFESTIAEPTELLSSTISEAFANGPPRSFESVFGQGNPQLVSALAQRYGAAHDQIVCTTGASSGLLMATRALLERSGHVLVEQPHFDLLSRLPRALGAEVTTIERSADFASIDPDALRKAIRADTKLVILTNPHNPSGKVLSASNLSEIASVADDFGVPVLVDEVYSDFIGDDGFTPAALTASCFLSVNSLTKVYGLFSLRCGWIIAQPETAARIQAANAEIEFGVSKLAHAVAVDVFERISAFDDHWRAILCANRPIVEKRLAAMQADELLEGEIPTHGCIFFPRVVDCADTRALAERLWDEHDLLVAHGEFFGCGGRLRIGFGDDGANLDDGLERLHRALKADRDLRAKPASRTRPTAAQA